MRLGIFGGSFDPVHFGHLLLAETCREQCQFDAIWFVPAAVPPHKQERDLAPASDRVEMLKLAIGGHPAFEVSTTELDRGGVSYTFETLSAIQKQQPDTELFLLMGADSLDDLPTWKEPEQVCALAIPVVVSRAGSPAPDIDVLGSLMNKSRLEEVGRHQVQMPIIEISSTDLRERAASGRSLRYQTPRAVEKFIEAKSLYR